jgi:phosphotransacetylase
MNGTSGTGRYEAILKRCRGLAPLPTAVAYPCEQSALAAAIDARAKRLIAPILVGPSNQIRQLAKRSGLELANIRIVDAADSRAAAIKAVELVRLGEAELLMKGSLHSDELLAAVVAKDTGLRTSRRISHVFVMDVPKYHKALVITDAAINIAPTLDEKVDICQNAIDLPSRSGRRGLGRLFAAVETVNPKSRHTDAAALCTGPTEPDHGGILDGPLASDNAISKEAARVRASFEVAGDADIRRPIRSWQHAFKQPSLQAPTARAWCSARASPSF